MDLVKVKDFPGLAKDENTGVVVNINNMEIEEAKKRKQLKIEKQKREKALVSDVNELKKDMSEIKDLLKKLVED